MSGLAGASVLVTGSAGLIGRATVAALVRTGATVRGFDMVATEAEGVESHEGDLRDAVAVASAVDGVDAVVHLGGVPGLGVTDDVTTYEVNVVGTFSVFAAAAARGVPKIVYASSINANGLPLGQFRPPGRFPYSEAEPAEPADPYSLSKAANEQAAVMAHRRWGVELTGLRFPLVRDLRHDRGVAFAAHVRAALAADPLRQAYEGWSYLDLTDAGRAVIAALGRSTPAAPGILVAAPRTYLEVDTAVALQQLLPGVPHDGLHGRQVGLDLRLSEALLDFEASIALEDMGFELLAPLGQVR